MNIASFILGVLLTALSYMAFPLIKMFINRGRFSENRAHKIALWNSIVLGIIFCILTDTFSEGRTVWSGGPAVLYYWINRSILTDKNATEETSDKVTRDKAQKTKNIVYIILKGIGAFLLGVISSDMLLLILFGDSIDGITALLTMFLAAIPFSMLFFWLFTRHDKKKTDESYNHVNEEVSTQSTTNSHMSRPPQISCVNEKTKTYGNNDVPLGDLALQASPSPSLERNDSDAQYQEKPQPYEPVVENNELITDSNALRINANRVVLVDDSSVSTKKVDFSKTKVKYCSRCGSLIDNQTKQCTGCGKKCFKGIRITKISCVVLSLSFALIAAIGFIVYQYNEINLLELQTKSLNNKVGSLSSEIGTLKTQKSNLQDKVNQYEDLVEFVNDHVVFVEDDGTKLYHKYECYKFKGNSFWVYNIENAIYWGYKECSACH